MSRIAIVGPRKKLDAAIRSLYELNIFHIVDYVSEDPEVKIGVPLPRANDVSQKLLRLRSIARALHLDDYKPDKKVTVDEIERTTAQAIMTLDLEVTKKIENRLTLNSRIRELTAQNDALDIFREIGLPLELYLDYEALNVYTGISQEPIEERMKALDAPMEFLEISYGAGFAFSVFCKKSDAASVQGILNNSGYQELKPPYRSGEAEEHIITNAQEIEKLQKTLADEDSAIEALREEYAALILASEEHYSIDIQQAEAPLRVATTLNSFAIDGWVPVSSADSVRRVMAEKVGDDVAVETLPVSKHEEDEHAPVKLRNTRFAKPFELFVELMSTPLYREVDPTIFVFTVFPLFFGLMISDLGYGACLMLAGLVMWKKLGKDSEGWRKLGLIVLAGGLFAALFGLLLFHDAFGLPFHPVLDERGALVLGGLSWETTVGIYIPLGEAPMEKLVDVKDLLAISVLAAWIHMSVGLILGFRNELSHSRKHAATKVFWLVILFGLFAQILFMAKGSPLRDTLFMTFCSSFAGMVIPFSGLNLSIVALSLILVGVAGFFALHGKGAMMELMEILSLLANVISYTRIAAIGVAKGAMALAFNYIVVTYLFSGGNIFLIIAGAFVLVLLQLLVFALGSLSAGIQALRLNYVEFFLKFYTGGGVSFEPLGYRRKYSEKSEV
jgi:V/A-type H+-transporting ATPase subunit I